MPAAMRLALLLLLWLSPAAPAQETGSCFQPRALCCLGMNHHCKRGNCYCDEFCHVASDCCPDHSALCNPVSPTPTMLLQMVLRIGNLPHLARNNLDLVQSMVQHLLQTSLPGMPISISVKGIQKTA